MLWDVPPWVPVSGGGFAVHFVPFWLPSFGLGVVAALLLVFLVVPVVLRLVRRFVKSPPMSARDRAALRSCQDGAALIVGDGI